MTKKTTEPTVEVVDQPAVSKAEMDELKRDMRSAKWNDWAKNNQQSIVLAIGLLLFGLVGGGMWLEHSRSQHDAAATLFQQAVNETETTKKTALLESLSEEFHGSAYGAMAQMQLVTADSEHAEAHLQALMDHDAAMPEWKWQARLDLANLKVEQGDKDAARALLQPVIGTQYQQARHYLLAGLTDDKTEKKNHLQKALDAAASDLELKQRIEAELSLLSS